MPSDTGQRGSTTTARVEPWAAVAEQRQKQGIFLFLTFFNNILI